jgi:hypothetical protein
MGKIFYIVMIVLAFSVIINAQVEDSLSNERKDSVNRHLGIRPLLKIKYNLELDFPFLYSPFQSNKLIEGDKNTLWLRTEIALSYFSNYNSSNENPSNDLMSPLYEQYLENSKFNPIKYVLGMAQLTAVGYLAYRHIKKYGFLK